MSGYSRRGERASSSSFRPTVVSSTYRNSRDAAGERSERAHSVKGIISGVERDREAPRNSGRNSPVYRDKEREYSFHKRPDSDSKITTHARRLSRTETQDGFLNACHQIETLLQFPDNQKYIIKCFSFLEHEFLDAFRWIQGATWKEAGIQAYGKLMAAIFYAMGTHSHAVSNWLVDSIFNVASSRKYSLAVVIRDVLLTAIAEMKQEQITILMNSLHEHLDKVFQAPLFKIFATLFSTAILKNQCNTRSSTFQDFGDILIGWMTDADSYEDELGNTYNHCYAIVQSIEPFFAKEIKFLVDLISSIVDVIEEVANAKDLNSDRILRLLKTLESLLILRIQLDKKFLGTIAERFIKVINVLLFQTADCTKLDRKFIRFIQYSNECLILCPGVRCAEIYSYMQNQLRWFQSEEMAVGSWNSDIVIVFLGSLSNWIDTVGAQSQLSVEIQEFCGEVMSFLDRFQPYLSQADQLHVLRVVQSLLRTRNLTLLQNVYQWVVGKLLIGNNVGEVDNPKKTKTNIEIQLFALASLTDIATNKSGSILSLWVLDPSIIDLLMPLSKNANYDSVRNSALEMLKSHCIAHSNFTSSITSSKAFEAESPALRFLNSLMNFWTSMIRKMDGQWITWLFDWITQFLKSTTPYAPLLIERHSEFYKEVLTEFATKPSLLRKLGDLLQWMAQEANYMQSSTIQDVIREISLRVLLHGNQVENVETKYSEILKLLPKVVVLPYELPNFMSLGNADESDWKEDEQVDSESQPILTNSELNSFLQDLLIYGKSDQPDIMVPIPSKATIKAAVDYLLRSKLKTTLGRAQEFFSQLQHMVRKIIRRGVYNSFLWKLDFVYQLQRKILLCIYESAFLVTDIPDSIRSFYVTNKIPCTGWLKRIGPECIEVSLAVKSYAMAYFFSVSIQDDAKAKLALFHLQDAEGLKGMKELAGYFYLNSEYEKAEHLATVASTNSKAPDYLSGILLEKTKLIFEGSMAKLEAWPTQVIVPVEPLDGLILSNNKRQSEISPPSPPLLKLPVDSMKSLLSIQLEHFGSKAGVDVIGGVESFSKLFLYEMIQVEDLILNSNKFTWEDKRRMQSCRLKKMIECGNLRQTRNWITTSGWLDMNQLDVNLERKVDAFQILGDLLYKEGNCFESGTLYSSVLELIEEDGNAYHGQPAAIPDEFKASFYLSFAAKVKKSDTFYQRGVTKSTLLTSLEGRHQTQQLFHDRARESSRNCSTQVRADAWFDYATFAYERSEEEDLTPILKEVFKSNSLHSYSNFIKWNQRKKIYECDERERKGKIIMAMIRLVKLYHQNHKFIPEDLLTSNLWLKILPELAKISELRPYIISKFPEAATFLVASLEYSKMKERFAKRRGIFDPATFSYTEATEEFLNYSSQENQLCAVENQGRSISLQGNADLLPCLRNYFTIVKEIERIGTTKEELWAGVIQRMSSDWMKRGNTLRKDLARDRGGNPEKVKAYVYPVFTFLKEFWRLTCEGDTPADVAFICKYSVRINEVINELESCSTPDKFTQIHEVLLNYACIFESSRSSKLFLVNMSPILAEYDFMSGTKAITFPGLSRGVTITSAHATVTCLPTKTNPKKISFRGSDGRIYEYLVKGNENLHIDAGIMQLLKVTEEFTGCPTRHYFVTPIGERGGLIQIVRNALPLFVLYKKYLQRNNLTERPSEMFWRRLECLGFKDRSDVSSLKEVYNSLKKETPSDLISRDLLLCAENTMDWYRAVQTFTRDCAMGSAMGHIVGLADRHLDNILINLRQGQLVHVDFSILFGKGAQLKVPETVPFRLTQNIVEALQYPGVYGAFAIHLDKFLYKFQEGKELVMFCVNNIAEDSQLEEGVHISPQKILQAELKSTLELIHLRVKNIWKIMEILLGEFQECLTQLKATSSSVWVLNSSKSALERLKKKIYRWRRLLANIDPLIQFVIINTIPTGSLAGFHDIVIEKWNPFVMHFWLHAEMELLLKSTSVFEEKFKLCKNILQTLVNEIHTSNAEIEIRPGPIVYSGEQVVDKRKLESIMSSVGSRISAFIPSETAKALIDEAINEDNLGQMFEGWISWV